jgi:FkbM family methyltransferase
MLGSRYGGWVIPTSRLDSKSICYCIGCGEDVTFDVALINMFDCCVYAYDPTPKSVEFIKREITPNYPNFKFFPYGLWREDGIASFYVPRKKEYVSHSIVNIGKTDNFINLPVMKVSTALARNRHNGRKLTLLKLDIEGAEYEVLDQIISDNVEVDILCIEFEEVNKPRDSGARGRVEGYLGKLQQSGWDIVAVPSWGNYTLVREAN